MASESVTIRRARRDDADAVAAFTADTWPERGDDYVADVFAEWVAAGGDDRRTFVAADADDEAVGLVQGALLSEYEAWVQGLRVAREARGGGVGAALLEAGLDWAREQGASVARCMVFSWNVMGLGGSRAVGFEPATEFRWVHPDPDADATPDAEVRADADDAWTFWTRSAACRHLRGLALDGTESWAVSELTRARLAAAAADDRLFAVSDERGVRGFAFRVGTDSFADEVRAEYGVAAWADPEACRDVLTAVSRDAASIDAAAARVLVPERVGTVSDVATARVDVGDDPDFVMTADLAERD